MEALGWIVSVTVAISLIGWIGVLTFFIMDDLLERLMLVLVALAAGSLLGGAFIHLLPRAIEETGHHDLLPLFLYLIGGFCVFYVLEQFIQWHHHHSTSHEHEPFSYLILVSDGLHNFIDGLIIAAAFLVSVPLGLVTALVIALHEIPQELGDFGVLVYGGFDKRRALVLNYLTQATVVIGGVFGFYLSSYVSELPAVILAFAAGNFIYIASSDLVPEIKHEEDTVKSMFYFSVFLLGILMMLGIKLFRQSYIGGH